ncbi:MAG: biopolymer transporter ExbD [Fulvivirga sp.]|uniref:ExbD/TolR family protein n=1 Tax=Fulvivirga sp. TaxID=1931237 RepID=UPI0032EDECB2
MSRFKKTVKNKTEITTASLPDIVFLLLFFFMVSATIKTKDKMVETQLPEAKEMTKVEMKTLIREVSVGKPVAADFGNNPKISVGNRLIELDEIVQWVIAEKETLPEAYKDQIIILLKADEEVQMGLISDVQQKLRKANARKILFRTLDE